MKVEEIIIEVGNIADLLSDTPIYFSGGQSAEGIDSMIQAAEAFRKAESSESRLDAALWLGEAYLLFSGSLPDTGNSEYETSWATASQIGMLLGGPDLWAEKMKAAYGADS